MSVLRVALLMGLFSALMRDANAVKCFACVHMQFPSGVPNVYNNPYCETHTFKSLTYAGEDCPNDGKDYVCAKIFGRYTFDLPNAGIAEIGAVVRRCVTRPAGLETTDNHSDMCVKSEALDESTNDIDLIGASADVGDMLKFNGDVCYCNGNNCNSASVIGHKAFLVALIMGVMTSLMILHY